MSEADTYVTAGEMSDDALDVEADRLDELLGLPALHGEAGLVVKALRERARVLLAIRDALKVVSLTAYSRQNFLRVESDICERAVAASVYWPPRGDIAEHWREVVPRARAAVGGYEYVVVKRGYVTCGYVRIPEGHPYHGAGYEDLPVQHACTSSGTPEDIGAPAGSWWLGADDGGAPHIFRIGELMAGLMAFVRREAVA